MAAISFKRLVEEDEEDEELGPEEDGEIDKLGEKGRIVFIDDEENDVPSSSNILKRKNFVHRIYKRPPCACSCPVSSWLIITIALICLTSAVMISMLLTLTLTPQHKPLYGAVASDASMCSTMAGRILERGGSAVDAAIVAMLCAGTVHPESSGIAGGGFMVVFDPSDQSVQAIDFRETAPQNSTVDMFMGDAELSSTGSLAVGVPGELAGMKMAHDLYGKLPWSELFEPVIELARDGFPLTEHTLNAITDYENLLKENKRFNDWFYENDTLKSLDDIVRRPYFADVLEKIATKGIEEFYNGTIAKEIINTIQENDGIMTLQDLSLYKPLLLDPVHIQFEDAVLYAPPLPSGGPQMLFMINVMENMNLTTSDRWKNLTYQHLVETFKFSFAARSRLGDPYCTECSTEQLLNYQNKILSEEYAALINKSISNTQTFPPEHYNGSYFVNDQGTTHISVIDTEGMAVSVTTTINGYFGAKLITPSGIVLNNEMDDFSAPNITNSFGLLPWKANFVAPGKRPLSSTCPTIALKKYRDGKSYAHLVVGGAGGSLIGTTVAQVILRTMAFKESISEAIEGRNLHNQLYPDILYYEDGFPDSIIEYLESLGHKIRPRNKLSVIMGAMQYEDGIVEAHSDSRKDEYSKSYVYTTTHF